MLPRHESHDWYGRLKLTPKIAGSILASLVLTSAVGAYITSRRINAQAEQAFIDRLRKTDGMASKVRVFFSENIENYVPNHDFKRISQVPVVVAWTVARDYAESQGMKFSTPSLAPRNPRNQPDAFEREALEAFARDPSLPEYFRRDTVGGLSVMRYAQPVRLTQDCLFCHGDPVGAKDPFGYTKEGMKAGDLKGAFVVTAPVESLAKTASSNGLAVIVINLCTFAGAMIVVFFVVRRFVVAPVVASSQLAAEIAHNNLAVEDIEITSADEIGEALGILNGMKNNLHTMVENIASTAASIASAGHELSRTAAEQSSASSAQTDRTAQVATAMHEMSATVAQVSDSAGQAAKAADRATEAAHAGGSVVQESVVKMRTIASTVTSTGTRVQELGDASKKIGEIVAVIEDIADQTNLLALNAAIEAARAGDQGRGFAVVADEVRKLAERTGQATKEIASRIHSIQTETATVVQAIADGSRQVEEGVSSTELTGKSLSEIIEMNDRVRDMINQIAVTTAEQSATSAEVSNNVAEIARLAGDASGGAKQAAKACEEISALALDLDKIVRQFVLRGSTRTSFAGDARRSKAASAGN